MGLISTDRPRHSTDDQVTAQLATGEPLRAADAAAIAAWWQAPGGHGLTFALLAQGTPVDAADVIAACEYELTTDTGTDNRAELAALADWARAEAARGHWSACDPLTCDDDHCTRVFR